MTEMISGIVTAVLIIIITQLLSKFIATRLVAMTTLVAIAFIYVGFSLKNNPANAIILETATAMVFYFLAIAGYIKNNSLAAYGIILHGVWDIIHFNGFLSKTDIPSYWPLFCSIVDLIDGVYFVLILKKARKEQLHLSAYTY